jgi:hypothetical protein
MGPQVQAISLSGRAEYEVIGLDARSPVFRTRAEAEAFLRAVLAKQPAGSRPRVRPCLRCGRDFRSAGFHDRLCDACGHHAPVSVSAGGLVGLR